MELPLSPATLEPNPAMVVPSAPVVMSAQPVTPNTTREHSATGGRSSVKLTTPAGSSPVDPATPAGPAPVSPAGPAAVRPAPTAGPHRPIIRPLAEEAFRVQFTASRETRDKLREAQALLRHQVPDGDLAKIVDLALDLLLADTKQKRFAVGKKVRSAPKKAEAESSPGNHEPSAALQQQSAAPHQQSAALQQQSAAPRQPRKAPPERPSSSRRTETRHIPAAIRRAVFERDGGRCAFVDARGQRCPERGGLELDHLDGYARTQRHSVDRIRLACRAHNRHAADRMYGREFMEEKPAQRSERGRNTTATRSGTSSQPSLL
jgi:5-methylcytosine-specific restriction endonuclease McrA